MYVICIFLLCSFLVETFTQLIQKSVFFGFFRGFFSARRKKRIFSFIDTLLQCPYCTSVWVSLFVVFCAVISGYNLVIFGNIYVDWFLFFVACHRMSNLIHDVWDRYLTRHYLKEQDYE